MSATDGYAIWLASLHAPAVEAREPEALIPASDLVRGRRARDGARARSISVKRLSKRELWRGSNIYPDVGQHDDRPRTRGECPSPEDGPCPWVSCKHHLYLDVSERTGSIKLNFPDLEVWELPVSCALDVADRGGLTLEEVGKMMNVTRERVRQLELRALTSLAHEPVVRALADALRAPGDAPRGEVVEVKTWGAR